MVQGARTASEAERYFDAARRVLPGGVTAAAGVHGGIGRPLVIARGQGARLYDVDGKEYVDFCTSFGASLLGHGHSAVRAAIEEALARGILCAHELPEHEEVGRHWTRPGRSRRPTPDPKAVVSPTACATM